MNFSGAGLGVVGIVVTLLFSTASGDLSSIDGAFGLSSADWRVVCFASACILVIASAAILYLRKSN